MDPSGVRTVTVTWPSSAAVPAVPVTLGVAVRNDAPSAGAVMLTAGAVLSWPTVNVTGVDVPTTPLPCWLARTV